MTNSTNLLVVDPFERSGDKAEAKLHLNGEDGSARANIDLSDEKAASKMIASVIAESVVINAVEMQFLTEDDVPLSVVQGDSHVCVLNTEGDTVIHFAGTQYSVDIVKQALSGKIRIGPPDSRKFIRLL